MINKIKLSLLVALLLATIGCKENSDPRFTQVKSTVKQIGHAEFMNKNAIVVIPNAGCEGCITTAESFVVNNIDQLNDVKIVFTGTNSQKSLKYKIGPEVYSHKNVFIDKENRFQLGELSSYYPLVIYLENGKVKEIVEQSPESPYALESLQVYLAEL